MAKEIWKAVVDFEGLYEVSDQGRVRSVAGHSYISRIVKKRVWAHV